MTDRWTIEIRYSTGDSFKTYETTGQVSMIWNNLDRAKAALKRIRLWDQREKYEDRPQWWDGPIPPPFEEIGGWKGKYEPVTLQLDDGTEQTIHAFWMGYFEHIREARIVPYVDPNGAGDDEMEYVP